MMSLQNRPPRRRAQQNPPPMQQGWQPPRDEGVLRGKAHRKSRRYDVVTSRQKRLALRLCAAGFAVVFIVCAVQLISYGVDYFNAKRLSAELRAIYYAQEEETVVPSATPEAQNLPTASAAPALAAVTAAPSPTPQAEATLLASVSYPNNPMALVTSRFKKLQRQNEDIIGWLTVEGMIDEAVVQRDNEFYLRRDYLGYHNVNGAIFLDELCDLRTRPYTLMLYGHNMKTGAMFGNLRNFENLLYYHNNPFITFDTAYEDGRFIVFAAGTISTEPRDSRYVNFAQLLSPVISQRQEALDALQRCSLYASTLDVTPEDQLLLLITCVDDDALRRVVCARRIRTDETEDELAGIARRTAVK